ncbi:MAG: cell division protein ZapA [Huintestinicola sp.]
MNIVNKVKVKICGKEYSLQTDETPDYLIGLAARVDKEINDLIKAKPNFGIQNAAVFVALTSLDEAKKAGESIDNIRSQIKTYVDDAAKARSAKEKLAIENKELKAKISALEKEIKELKKDCGCEQLVLENTITPAVMVYAKEPEPVAEEKPDEKQETAEVKTDTAEEKTEIAAENQNTSAAGSEEKPVSNGEETKEPNSSLQEKADGCGADESKAENDGNNTSNDDVKPSNNSKRSRKKRR